MAAFDHPAQYPDAVQTPYENLPPAEATVEAAQPYASDPAAAQPYATMQSFVSTQGPYQPSLPETGYIPEPIQPSTPEMEHPVSKPVESISASEGSEGSKKEQASELRARLESVWASRDM